MTLYDYVERESKSLLNSCFTDTEVYVQPCDTALNPTEQPALLTDQIDLFSWEVQRQVMDNNAVILYCIYKKRRGESQLCKPSKNGVTLLSWVSLISLDSNFARSYKIALVNHTKMTPIQLNNSLSINTLKRLCRVNSQLAHAHIINFCMFENFARVEIAL